MFYDSNLQNIDLYRTEHFYVDKNDIGHFVAWRIYDDIFAHVYDSDNDWPTNHWTGSTNYFRQIVNDLGSIQDFWTDHTNGISCFHVKAHFNAFFNSIGTPLGRSYDYDNIFSFQIKFSVYDHDNFFNNSFNNDY